MSLLLDALKSSESSYSAVDDSEVEDREESLDARATLELLTPNLKPAAPEPLSLATVPEAAPATQSAAPAPPGFARAPAAAPAAARSMNKFSVVCMALIVMGGMGLAVKMLWPKSYVVTYPESSGPAPQPTAASQPEAVSLHAVQIPSTRPADHFAYNGNAPEIDLHETSAVASAAPKTAVSEDDSPASHRHIAPAALSVTRMEVESAIYNHVKAGYQALASGDVAIAQREYQAAQQIDPNNIDALLGAAAAAARDGKPMVASEAYMRVLKLEPGNPDASAALAMLSQGAAANESAESHLKILIAGDDGTRPALHAALGGVYAADGRWSEAAQEYFAALGKDPGNPDLAFDVAASLDQNRNAAMALNFYQQALTFASQRPAQFDVRKVEERISRLQAKAAMVHPDAAGATEAR